MEKKEQPRQYNNGRRHPPTMKRRARTLRKSGASYKEISDFLNISKSTSYLWTSDIELSSKILQRIEEKSKEKAKNRKPWSPRQRKALGRRLRPYQFKKLYTNESLINEIRDFYKKCGRIPLKKELNSRRAFRIYFGTWNNAIIAAGFKPNPVFFAERVTAQDGHICDSFAEKIIDDWLTANCIPHERNVRYPGSKMTVDFYIRNKNISIEFFGLLGANRKYDKNHHRKLRISKKNNLQLLPLYIDDVLKQRYDKKLKRMLLLVSDNSS